MNKRDGRLGNTVIGFAPALPAIAYPYLLQAFNNAVGAAAFASTAAGWLCLLVAMSVPLAGLGWTYRLRTVCDPSDIRARARILALLMIGAPPLYVFIGVTRGLVGRPLTDNLVWLGLWALAIALVCAVRPANAAGRMGAPGPRLRVAHGIAASFIVLFVAFHLTNHLAGLFGPGLHATIMQAGRGVYRLFPVEVLLVGLLLFQVVSGLALALRCSRRVTDGFGVLQVGSGFYLACFIVAHLNSALVSARAVRHIETNWAWASGGAEGLLYDAWNIRLVPHYAYGVLFVLMHALLGLRHVLVAHGVDVRRVNRLWFIGLVASAAVATAIMAGLLGLRI